jgi:hypothetical protein
MVIRSNFADNQIRHYLTISNRLRLKCSYRSRLPVNPDRPSAGLVVKSDRNPSQRAQLENGRTRWGAPIKKGGQNYV